ncbi:MAG: hypothetical protein GX640_08280, partial [Fibrobacter sp.]|nr:hypothetical protein [Fibrobacter sp.]
MKKFKFKIIYLYYAAFAALLIYSFPPVLAYAGYAIIVLLVVFAMLVITQNIDFLISLFSKDNLKLLISQGKFTKAREYVEKKYGKRKDFKHYIKLLDYSELLASSSDCSLFQGAIQEIIVQKQQFIESNTKLYIIYSYVEAVLLLKIIQITGHQDEEHRLDYVLDDIDQNMKKISIHDQKSFLVHINLLTIKAFNITGETGYLNDKVNQLTELLSQEDMKGVSKISALYCIACNLIKIYSKSHDDADFDKALSIIKELEKLRAKVRPSALNGLKVLDASLLSLNMELAELCPGMNHVIDGITVRNSSKNRDLAIKMIEERCSNSLSIVLSESLFRFLRRQGSAEKPVTDPDLSQVDKGAGNNRLIFIRVILYFFLIVFIGVTLIFTFKNKPFTEEKALNSTIAEKTVKSTAPEEPRYLEISKDEFLDNLKAYCTELSLEMSTVLDGKEILLVYLNTENITVTCHLSENNLISDIGIIVQVSD